MQGSKRLLIVNFEPLAGAFNKGNAEYVRHYETYFDEIHSVFIYGFFQETVKRGKVIWRSLGSKRHGLDLLVAPIRILRAALKAKATAFSTSDLVFSWWSMSLIRLVLRRRVVLVPICYPEEIYSVGGRSVTGVLPIWLERLFIRLSFLAASSIVISKHNRTSIGWLRGHWSSARKVQIIDVIPEQYPAPALLTELLATAETKRAPHRPPCLLYVGRLHWQKLVFELVDLMSELAQRGVQARLIVAGDGPDMHAMQERARSRNVTESIEWLGAVAHDDLGAVYGRSDIFISTVTGTALREAAFSRLPVVGYDLRFFEGLLQHEHNALLVPVHDVPALATEVVRAMTEHDLRERIARQLHADILSRWNLNLIPSSLGEAFGE